MATPNTQSDEVRANTAPPVNGRTEADGSAREVSGNGATTSAIAGRVNTLCYSITGITAIGLLLVVFGAILTPNDLLILIGTGIVCLGAVGWIVLAILAMAGTIMRLFTSPGKAGAEPLPAKPERL